MPWRKGNFRNSELWSSLTTEILYFFLFKLVRTWWLFVEVQSLRSSSFGIAEDILGNSDNRVNDVAVVQVWMNTHWSLSDLQRIYLLCTSLANTQESNFHLQYHRTFWWILNPSDDRSYEYLCSHPGKFADTPQGKEITLNLPLSVSYSGNQKRCKLL